MTNSGIKISALPAANTLSGSESLPVVQDGATRQASIAQIVAGSQLVTAAGSTTPRSLADRFAQPVNVLDFGAHGDGTTSFDSLPAFNAAIASLPAGEPGLIHVPRSNGDYYLSAVTTAAGGRIPIFYFHPGVDIIGGPTAKLSWPTRWIENPTNQIERIHIAGTANPAISSQTIDYYKTITNIGFVGASAQRVDYVSSAYGAGFDILHTRIGRWERSVGQDGGQLLTNWTVAISPINGGPTTRWGVFCEEKNVMNRHADHGWSPRRGTLNNWAVIEQFVPESEVGTATQPSYNILAHIALCPSSTSHLTAAGYVAQAWNGLMIERQSIAPDGFGVHAQGNDTGNAARDPKAAFGTLDTWKYGTLTNKATIATGIAHGLGTSQRIAWLDSSDVEQAALYRGRVTNADPTVAADNTQGYGPGSMWLNTATNKMSLCISAGPGAAVWKGVVLT